MLVLILLIIIIIFSVAVVYFDIKFWQTEIAEIMGIVFGAISFVVVLVISVVLIVSQCHAPIAQAQYEEQYAMLTQKVAHIDLYDQCEIKEIKEMVREWNLDYRTNVEARKSPWVSAFYTLNTEKVDLIEMGGLYE